MTVSSVGVTLFNEEEVALRYGVVENVTVHAPGLIRRYVMGQAKAAHTETLSKMKVLLESRSPVARPDRS